MDAMPIAVWDLHAIPIHPHPPSSLRWSSDQDPVYIGPPGDVFHHHVPGTNQGVLIFEIRRPARFVFWWTLNPAAAILSPHQLRDFVKGMVYID